jgi:hypothetical protein
MSMDAMDDLSGLTPAAQANCRKLPKVCFVFVACKVPGTRIVELRRGERGCFETTLDHPNMSVSDARRIVQASNGVFQVTPAQQHAMIYGSLFGFDDLGADPDRYAEDGSPLFSIEYRYGPDRTH